MWENGSTRATTYEDGWLRFHVGDHFPASHYLIMAE